MKLLYFAAVRERMGRSGESLPRPPNVSTVGEVAEWLRARDASGAAAFAPGATIRAALNQAFAEPDALVQDADEIAFFPPVTGG